MRSTLHRFGLLLRQWFAGHLLPFSVRSSWLLIGLVVLVCCLQVCQVLTAVMFVRANKCGRPKELIARSTRGPAGY